MTRVIRVSGDLHRRGKLCQRVHRQAEASHSSPGDWRDANVAGDRRIGHGGDATLCEDHELVSLPENDRGLSGGDGVTGGCHQEDEAARGEREQHS